MLNGICEVATHDLVLAYKLGDKHTAWPFSFWVKNLYLCLSLSLPWIVLFLGLRGSYLRYRHYKERAKVKSCAFFEMLK